MCWLACLPFSVSVPAAHASTSVVSVKSFAAARNSSRSGWFERQRVAGQCVGVEQPREDLVQRVVRRPDLAVRRELLERRELPLAVRREESGVRVAGCALELL